MNKKLVLALMGMTVAGIASAADIDVTANITTSTQWTSNNVYHLRELIYVEPGATLSIQAGTKIVGYDPAMLSVYHEETRGDCSALIICRGAKIMAEGTRFNPIIFTSGYDDGTMRVSNTEWGNVCILGNAVIADGSESTTQNGSQFDYMEGLVPNELSKYGGTDDDDSSGVFRYVSLRYGGSVLGDADELNGLSMGGVGRGTVMEYIDIFNNTDDGIEIWGGTAQMKYVSIWNIGDDSLDLDEGYRGKIQFGLIVAGYSSFGEVGSGVGDRLFEMDGGENPTTMQPYANPQLYNWTAIGQPVHTGGGRALSFRDNMRLQIGNSIFMDVGAQLIHFGNANIEDMTNAFFVAHDVYNSTGVDFAGLPNHSTMADFYSSSRSGTWSWVKDSVMFNINDNSGIGISGKTVADIGLYDVANHNVVASQMPIVSITRDTTPGQPADMQFVTFINPLAANDAVNSVTTPPADGFFTPVTYRGAFSPNYNWLEGWTAAAEYGMTDVSMNSTAPSSTIQMTATTFWQSENDVVYTVEESADMVAWAPVASVTGDGSIMSATDLDVFDSAKFYRVSLQ